MTDESGNKTSVNIGDNNSLDVVKWLVIALIALAGIVGYVAYVSTWSQHRGEAHPPHVELPKP